VTAPPFTLLHVCTANICRSPMAERLTRAGLVERLGRDADQFVVASAGTRGHAGAPMAPHAATTLASYGLDGGDFRGRALDADLVAAAAPVERARELVRLAAARRGLVPPADRHDDDLPDPYGGPESGFAEAAQVVRRCLQHPLDLLVAGSTCSSHP
jgi:protein-tyrosine phosphatase